DRQQVRRALRRGREQGRVGRAQGYQAALQVLQRRDVVRRRAARAGETLDVFLRGLDLVKRRLELGLDRRLEVGLHSLDRGRGRDEKRGEGVRDRGRPRGIRVVGRDREQAAVRLRLRKDVPREILRRPGEAPPPGTRLEQTA